MPTPSQEEAEHLEALAIDAEMAQARFETAKRQIEQKYNSKESENGKSRPTH